MTTLVTGAAGFIGQHLVRRYLEIGRTVTAVDVNEEGLRRIESLGARILVRDLARRFDSEEAAGLQSIRTIIHCAAHGGTFGRKKDLDVANVESTRTMVQLAEDIDAKRFIFLSSSEVYARTTDQLLLHENDDLPTPISHFAATKARAEEEVLTRLGRGTVVLRPRAVYGSGDTQLIPRLLGMLGQGSLPLMRGGAAVTDLTHVHDLVEAVLAAERTRSAAARIFNISGGEALNIKDAIDQVAAEAGLTARWKKSTVGKAMAAARMAEAKAALGGYKAAPHLSRDMVRFLAFSQTHDISRARAHLDWVPKISLSDGLAETFQGTIAAAPEVEVAAGP